VRIAAAAGKAIVCAKPLGRTGTEAAEMLRIARDAGVMHGYAETEVFSPNVMKARAMIESGAIGDVLSVRAREAHSGPHATHFWDAELAGGARAVLTVSQVSTGRKNRIGFEIAGSQASLAWNGERPEELWVGRRGAPSELILRDPATPRPRDPASRRRRAHAPPGRARRRVRRHVPRAVPRRVRCRRGGRTARRAGLPTYADGHEEALIGEAVARSAAEGRWVTVAEELDRV
jgi:predicted dehydrogenase